jgi:hypothetical protein
MSYFMLECFEPMDWDDSAMLGRSPRPPGLGSWRTGERFPAGLAEPVEFALVDTHSDRLREFYNVDALVMTKRLAQALRDAGVDNLDVYEAIIRHSKTGLVEREYVAANLVGIVSAVDMSQSNAVGSTSGNLLDVDFDGLRIDATKATGLLMFRLAENTSAVVIDERVKDYLLAHGFDMLTFVPPEEFIG